MPGEPTERDRVLDRIRALLLDRDGKPIRAVRPVVQTFPLPYLDEHGREEERWTAVLTVHRAEADSEVLALRELERVIRESIA